MTNIYIIKTTGTNSTDKAYLVDNLNNLNWSIDTPVTPMPLPEDSHEENILVKMEGNTAKMDLSWTLTTGTQFGTINTSTNVFTPGSELSVFKQIDEFKTQFVPISIGDAYTVLVTDENNQELMRDEGTISNMSFSVSGSSPIVWNVNCSFYVGNVVAILEADIPQAPVQVVMDSVNSTTISYTFTAYDGYGSQPVSGDSNFITGHIVKYKEGNGSWVTRAVTSGQTPVNITGLTSGKTYRLRLAQVNGNSADAATYYWRNATKINTTDTEITLP